MLDGAEFGASGHRDAGFTLLEVLLSTVILVVIIGALAEAIYATAHNSTSSVQRVNESHDVQIASAYLATDVQSAKTIVTPGCGTSGTSPTTLINLSNDGVNPTVS